MLFDSKMAFVCKKYIRDGIYKNRIYKIAFPKLKNKRWVYTIFENGLLYIANAAFSSQTQQNRYIQFLKKTYCIYCYGFNKTWKKKFYILNIVFQNRI